MRPREQLEASSVEDLSATAAAPGEREDCSSVFLVPPPPPVHLTPTLTQPSGSRRRS